MLWEAWVLTLVLIFNVIMVVTYIGKSRQPIDTQSAIITILITGFEIWLLLRLGGAL